MSWGMDMSGMDIMQMHVAADASQQAFFQMPCSELEMAWLALSLSRSWGDRAMGFSCNDNEASQLLMMPLMHLEFTC